MSKFNILTSALDPSVNIVLSRGPGQAEEARVIRRGRKLIIYLSSQTGCNMGCKMCWLTTTRQTRRDNLTTGEVIRQAETAANEAAMTPGFRGAYDTLHFNFMARGEFFDNPLLVANGEELIRHLLDCTLGIHIKRRRVLISTIMPRSLTRSLADIFPNVHPEIYYSLYTADSRKHGGLFPAAMPVYEALQKLRKWQLSSGKLVRIHLPLIEGFNDTVDDWRAIETAVADSELRVGYNLVRYNPPNEASREARFSAYQQAADFFRAKVVDRVGEDVFASCGMFYDAR